MSEQKKNTMTITLEVEVGHLDVEIKVGDPITLEELTAAAGSDLDAVVTSLSRLPVSRLPEELKGTAVERGLDFMAKYGKSPIDIEQLRRKLGVSDE